MANRVYCEVCRRYHFLCECGHRDVEHINRTGSCWPMKDFDPNELIKPMAELCPCADFKLKIEVKEKT